METSRGRAFGQRGRLNDASNSCGGSVDSSLYTPASAPFVPPSTLRSACPPRSKPVSQEWILAWGGG